MLLTIAIPSHNATHYLEAAIHSIIQEPEFGQDVDLCISDNSPSETTTELYRSRYEGNLAIQHHRSLSYKSLDANVNRAVELATGTYVWIFGDDDLIEPGILARLVPFLEQHQPDLVVLNSSSFQEKAVIEPSRVAAGVHSRYGPDDDNAFLRDLGGYLTYAGAILVRRDLWVQHYDPSKIGSFFAHIAVLAALKRGRTVHYFPQPAIRMRMHSQTWKPQAFQIWHRYLPDLIWSLPGYSSSAMAAVIPPRPINSPRRMLAARAYGRLNLAVWRQSVVPFRDATLVAKAFTLLLCLLPQQWFAGLYRLLITRWRRRHSLAFSPALALSQLPLNRPCKP